MGIFIQINANHDNLTTEMAAQLVTVCPVDIFAQQDGQLVIRAEQEDECTLCELCLDLAPEGALIIQKLYKNETLVSRG